MKVFLALSAFLLTVGAVSYEEILTQEWMLYKVEHQKSYASAEEDAQRMKIFLGNKLFVAEHNARYHKGEETFDVELNRFADWLPEEIEQLRGVNMTLGRDEPGAEVFVPTPGARIPSEVDWVKEGAVTSVKGQGVCGSCYAFSAVGSLEGLMFLKNKKLESLSVQNIVDCSGPQGNQGCNGGFPHLSFKYVQENNGINSEAVYPYEGKVGRCRYKSNKVAATCKGYVQVEKNEKTLQEATATIGPIAVCLDARHQSFVLYKSGVYNEPKCDANKLGHAVVLVGYGVDQATKKDYWLIKNSWTAVWGEKGYMRLARNANNMCGIATLATYPKV